MPESSPRPVARLPLEPTLVTSLPGPNARAMIDRDGVVVRIVAAGSQVNAKDLLVELSST